MPDPTPPEPLNDRGRWVPLGPGPLGHLFWSWKEDPSDAATRPSLDEPRTLLGWTVPDHLTVRVDEEDLSSIVLECWQCNPAPYIVVKRTDRSSVRDYLTDHAHGASVESQSADPGNASERGSQPGGSGIHGDPRQDPIGTVRSGRDGRAAVKVALGDDTGKGQHVWLHVTDELERRWFHHVEVAGLPVQPASERPIEGQREVCPDPVLHDSEAIERTHLRLEEQRKAAEQRASSWWEAAKQLRRYLNRAHKQLDRQTVDVAEAMARNGHERARADAAKAERDEAIEMVKTCTGHPDRANPDVPSHPELIQAANARADAAEVRLRNLQRQVDLARQAKEAVLAKIAGKDGYIDMLRRQRSNAEAERDEARAKLDAVRLFIAEREEYITAIKNCPPGNTADYHRWQGHAEARRRLAALLDHEPVTDREESAGEVQR